MAWHPGVPFEPKCRRLGDWVLTRVVSVAAHGLDVAITLGRDPWTTPQALRAVTDHERVLLGPHARRLPLLS